MENKNENQKMDIDDETPQNQDQDIPMEKDEEEEEEINTGKSKDNQDKSKIKNTSSAELNASMITNYSTNSKNSDKSSNKSNDPKIIISSPKPNIDYLFNLEYFEEMYANLLYDEKNLKLEINPNYMESLKPEINEKMREILVDWLIEVHHRLHFKRKTLFQTIYIIDLYLSYKTIGRREFQLLGVASLLISSKLNEIYWPKAKVYVDFTDNAYTLQELLDMEINIMKLLNFDILIPTPEEFYGIISKTYEFTREQHFLGEYLLDSSLIDYQMLKFKPSIIGISCAYIVMKFFLINGYKSLYSSIFTLKQSKDNLEKTIKQSAKELCKFNKELSSQKFLKSIISKYSLQEFGNVAELMAKK